MKVKLIYNLPEEKNEFRLCQNGADYFSALWEIKNGLRDYYKYDNITESNLISDIQDIIDGIYFEDID